MLSFHPISGAPISGTPRKFTLVAGVGAFSLDGNAVALRVAGEAQPVSHGMPGIASTKRQRVKVLAHLRMRAEPAHFTLIGHDVNLVVDRSTTVKRREAEAYAAFRRKLSIERDDLEVLMEL